MENNTSKKWKNPGNRQELLRNALVKSMGYTQEDLDRPIVGVINSWAETNPGHYHFNQLSEAIKRGVWAAGGFPMEVNTFSICEVFFDLSSMIYRNLLTMVTEELLARHPFDGVVIIGGCDKDIPAQLMAAITVDKPTLFLPGGAMLPGSYKGETLACGTDSFKLWAEYQSGRMTKEELLGHSGCLYGSAGACPIMGTANSGQTILEALGIALPGSSSSLGVSAEKSRMAEYTGRRIVGMIEEGLTISKIINEQSIRNAIRVLMAVGGSTNWLIHFTAVMRRAGISMDLLEFSKISDDTPLLLNVKPHGTFPVGQDFHNAGGLPALMKELEPFLDNSVKTCTGKSLKENLAHVETAYSREIIKPLSNPIKQKGGICILKGNLAPEGAVVKRSAATEKLLKHTGPAKVFDSLEVAEQYLLDEHSDMTADTVIVLRGYGPVGAPGMPEFGNYLPIPPKLYKQKITDYVRITDSRMSGGAYGTVILHVSPESAVGGPLAIVCDGDMITIDADNNLLEVDLSPSEIQERLKGFIPKKHQDIKRGFVRNFIDNVLQAHEGCDMRYL